MAFDQCIIKKLYCKFYQIYQNGIMLIFSANKCCYMNSGHVTYWVCGYLNAINISQPYNNNSKIFISRSTPSSNSSILRLENKIRIKAKCICINYKNNLIFV